MLPNSQTQSIVKNNYKILCTSNAALSYVLLKEQYVVQSACYLSCLPFYSNVVLVFLEQVDKRLKLTLELVKKDMEISKLQVIHCLSSCS
jgi:hypothetical protein